MKRNNLKQDVSMVRETMATYANKFSSLCIPEYTLSAKANFKGKLRGQPTITNSTDLSEVLRRCFDDDTFDFQEEFIALFLNRNNNVIGFYPVSKGGVSGTVADPRIILLAAVLVPSTSFIVLSHNHPSGNLKPSIADQEITIQIKEAAKYHSLKVLDHIIMAREGYFSFADEGIL